MIPSTPEKFDLLIVDESHNCAPSGRGKYATDSMRTSALRTLAPHFEHKLFLTATPHNGYPESFLLSWSYLIVNDLHAARQLTESNWMRSWLGV